MRLNDWKRQAEEFSDIDRAAQKQAEDAIALHPKKPQRFRYWQGVRYVAPHKSAPNSFARCGSCGRAWDDDKPTAWTPTPSGRCPFEYWHKPT